MVFVSGYLLSLALIWAGAGADRRAPLPQPMGRRRRSARRSRCDTAFPRTSANSFEPYFHPRMLAFGLGAARHRGACCAGAPGRRSRSSPLAAIVHVTTALWFAVLIGVGARRSSTPRMRRLALAGRGLAAVVAAWALTAGRSRPSFTHDGRGLAAGGGRRRTRSLRSTGPGGPGRGTWRCWPCSGGRSTVAAVRQPTTPAGPMMPNRRALLWGATALVACSWSRCRSSAARWRCRRSCRSRASSGCVDLVALIYVIAAVDVAARTGAATRHPAASAPRGERTVRLSRR